MYASAKKKMFDSNVNGGYESEYKSLANDRVQWCSNLNGNLNTNSRSYVRYRNVTLF